MLPDQLDKAGILLRARVRRKEVGGQRGGRVSLVKRTDPRGVHRESDPRLRPICALRRRSIYSLNPRDS